MEYFGFLYILASIALIIALLILVIRWPLGIHKTFSMHAAQSDGLSTYYTAVFSITMSWMATSLVALAVFTELTYVAPLLFAIAAVAQIVCTIFPESGSWRFILTHRIFAGVSAAFLLLSLIAIASQTSGTHQVYAILGTIVMGVCALLAMFSKERFSLILQSIFYLAFLIPTAILIAW